MPIMHLPRQLAQHAAGQTRHDIPASNLGQLVDAVCAKFPQLALTILDGKGQLSPFIGVFVDGEQCDAPDMPLQANSSVQLVAAVAGG